MARPADANRVLHDFTVKVAFVFSVMMPCPWNEVVAREGFEAFADWTLALHDAARCGCALRFPFWVSE
jgi:hypothetical protein